MLLIDQYLDSYRDELVAVQDTRHIGLKGIRKVLLKQMRTHLELLSTTVPEGIASYDRTMSQSLEEQLDLLEQTLREFERH